MKSERVTRTWEFYRDNCDGFKDSMRKEFRKLDEYVSSIETENAKLRELVSSMYRNMQGVLDRSTDTVWVDKIATLRDCMDGHMEVMAELGIPPRDYEDRMRELETGDHDWCPMQLSGLARCEGPDPVLKAENAKLRKLCKDLYNQVKTDDSTWERIRRREDELPCYADHFIAGYDCSLGKVRIADGFADRIRELGIEVDHV